MTKKIPFYLSAFMMTLGMLLWPLSVAAAGASISLTASRSTLSAGATVIIGIYINGGGAPVNAVQTDISYPASKLQYVGFSASGSAFEIAASNGGGDGFASIARGTTSSVSGSALVGTVTLRALSSSGSATIGVAGSSSLVSDGNAVGYGSSGVTVNFGVAPPAPAATPPPPKDTTPPVITAVKYKDMTPFSAVITWTTSEAADSTVEYGLDANYGLSAGAAAAVTAHQVTLNSAFLTPQTLLHFRVKSTDGAGNVTTGTDQTLQLPGVMVTVIVRGPGGQPQKGVSVTLDGSTGLTDSKGRVTLVSSLGNKKIISSYQGATIQKSITVTKTAKPLPPYQLDLSKQPINQWMLSSAGLLFLVLTLLIIDAFLFGSKILSRLTGLRIHKKPVLAPAVAGPPAAPAVPTAPSPPLPTPPAPSSPELKAAPEPRPEAPLPTLAEPPIDATKTVAELMGEAPVSVESDEVLHETPITLSTPLAPLASPSFPGPKLVTRIAVQESTPALPALPKPLKSQKATKTKAKARPKAKKKTAP